MDWLFVSHESRSNVRPIDQMVAQLINSLRDSSIGKVAGRSVLPFTTLAPYWFYHFKILPLFRPRRYTVSPFTSSAGFTIIPFYRFIYNTRILPLYHFTYTLDLPLPHLLPLKNHPSVFTT